MESTRSLLDIAKQAALEVLGAIFVFLLLPVGIAVALWRDFGFRLLLGAKDGWGVMHATRGSVRLLALDHGTPAYLSRMTLVLRGTLVAYDYLGDGRVEMEIVEAPRALGRAGVVRSMGRSWVLTANGASPAFDAALEDDVPTRPYTREEIAAAREV